MSTGALAGRTAVVTGGARGIGLAISRALASEGARVIVGGRSQAMLEEVAAELGGGFLCLDLLDREALDASLATLLAEEEAIDILVNNAGIAESAPLHRTTDDAWDRTFEVNVRSLFVLTRALVPPMTERGWGRVINVASIAGLAGQAYTSAYCASKHAVIGFTRALAHETARKGVTVNAVCPGWVETDMVQRAIDNITTKTGRDEAFARGALEQQSLQRRLIQPDEIGAIVSFLCGEGARGIHGQSIPVDGGTIMK